MKTLILFSRKVIILVIPLLIAKPDISGQQSGIRADDKSKINIDMPDMNSKSKQDVQWLFYTSENTGIPGSEIYRLAVDGYDNVWVDTNLGLVRFDGSVWKKLTIWVPDEAVSALAADNYGNIWVATADGALTRYDGGSGEVLIEPGSVMFEGYISSITFDNPGSKIIYRRAQTTCGS